MSKPDLLETLESMMVPNAEGHFWLGSTSYGRSLIDKAPLIEEIIPLAVEALTLRKQLSDNLGQLPEPG